MPLWPGQAAQEIFQLLTRVHWLLDSLAFVYGPASPALNAVTSPPFVTEDAPPLALLSTTAAGPGLARWLKRPRA